MAEWKEYISNNQQIIELKESKHGFLLRSSDHMYENEIIYADADFSCIDAFNVTYYLICEPHSLRTMIKQQADTGQPVYIKMTENTYQVIAMRNFDLCSIKNNKAIIKTNLPDWNIPNAEYSFTKFKDE